jgi:signal transduction histidine kinase
MLALVIEDSPQQATHLTGLLRDAGFSVHVAHDGESGVAMAAASPEVPDLIISDVVMPGIDGFEVCRRIKKDARLANVPVILLTGTGSPLDVLLAAQSGAHDFAVKPYDPDSLFARIWRALGATASDTIEVEGRTYDLSHAPRLGQMLTSALEDGIHREAALAESRRAVQREQIAREALMAMVAHELRTPLSSLLMRASLAKRGDAAMLEKLPLAVTEQVARMVRVIDDLHDSARIETGSLTVAREDVDLVQVVRDAVDRFRPTAEKHTVVMPEVAPVRARIDRGRIEQVLINFLNNAVKYSDAGRPITVRVQQHHERVRVGVRDEGMGIREEERLRVFERGFRTKEGAAKAPGLGIGLYVCRHVIELHDGKVGVDSQLGRGSEFWFEVPKAA